MKTKQAILDETLVNFRKELGEAQGQHPLTGRSQTGVGALLPVRCAVLTQNEEEKVRFAPQKLAIMPGYALQDAAKTDFR